MKSFQTKVPFYLKMLMVFLIMNNPVLHSQEKYGSLHGYIKSLQSVYLIYHSDQAYSTALLHNRLNYKYDFSTHAFFRLELRNRLFWGDYNVFDPEFKSRISQDAGLVDLSTNWTIKNNIFGNTSADRLLLDLQMGKWECTLGRQRIHWGMHNFWNPNDLFNTYDFLDFDYEERPGSDGLRIQYQSGSESRLEMAVAPGKHAKDHIAGALYKFNAWQYDFQTLCGLYKEELVIGAGWAGSIGKSGWKSECAYFSGKAGSPDKKSSFVFSTLWDYMFSGNYYLSLSALYQSQTNTSIALFGPLNDAQLSPKNLFPSEFTFMLQASKSIGDRLNILTSVLYAKDQDILLFYPSISWDAGNESQLDFTAQIAWAELGTNYVNLVQGYFLRYKWSY